jgi:integrase
MSPKTQPESTARPATVTIPELEQSKTAVLNALASRHSRRSYQYAIDRFIAWYCNEPRLTFNRSVVVSYRSSLERLSLSAATINLQLSAIRRLADESAESGWLSPELAIGIPRVKGVKRLGRKMGNWLTRNQAQDLINAASTNSLRGWRDGAMLGLLLGCGLRRSEVVGLSLDQVQSREGRWVIVNLVGKGGRLRTVPMPSWCKELVDTWLRHSGVSDGKVFRQVLKGGILGGTGVTANVVWYAVKRCAGQAGINNLAPHDLRRTCARLCHGCGGELEQIQFLLGHASVQTTERYVGSKQKLQDAVNDRLGISVASDDA